MIRLRLDRLPPRAESIPPIPPGSLSRHRETMPRRTSPTRRCLRSSGSASSPPPRSSMDPAPAASGLQSRCRPRDLPAPRGPPQATPSSLAQQFLGRLTSPARPPSAPSSQIASRSSSTAWTRSTARSSRLRSTSKTSATPRPPKPRPPQVGREQPLHPGAEAVQDLLEILAGRPRRRFARREIRRPRTTSDRPAGSRL